MDRCFAGELNHIAFGGEVDLHGGAVPVGDLLPLAAFLQQPPIGHFLEGHAGAQIRDDPEPLQELDVGLPVVSVAADLEGLRPDEGDAAPEQRPEADVALLLEVTSVFDHHLPAALLVDVAEHRDAVMPDELEEREGDAEALGLPGKHVGDRFGLEALDEIEEGHGPVGGAFAAQQPAQVAAPAVAGAEGLARLGTGAGVRLIVTLPQMAHRPAVDHGAVGGKFLLDLGIVAADVAVGLAGAHPVLATAKPLGAFRMHTAQVEGAVVVLERGRVRVVVDEVVVDREGMSESPDAVAQPRHARPAAEPFVGGQIVGVVEVVAAAAPSVDVGNRRADIRPLGEASIAEERLVERLIRHPARLIEVGEVGQHPGAHHDAAAKVLDVGTAPRLGLEGDALAPFVGVLPVRLGQRDDAAAVGEGVVHDARVLEAAQRGLPVRVDRLPRIRLPEQAEAEVVGGVGGGEHSIAVLRQHGEPGHDEAVSHPDRKLHVEVERIVLVEQNALAVGQDELPLDAGRHQKAARVVTVDQGCLVLLGQMRRQLDAEPLMGQAEADRHAESERGPDIGAVRPTGQRAGDGPFAVLFPTAGLGAAEGHAFPGAAMALDPDVTGAGVLHAPRGSGAPIGDHQRQIVLVDLDTQGF